MKEPPASRNLLKWVYSGSVLLALGLLLLVGMVEVSSQPQFCGTCHVMGPYYESWRHSSHSEVACVDCHIPPGVANEIRKKTEALSMVVSYFTGTYGTRPWAEIEDTACLECHERRLLAGKEILDGILFDHGPHLTEMRRGKRLRCTSCHSQIVQGQHITVTTSTCILCHFKGEAVGEGESDCRLCHEVPDRQIELARVTFDHSTVKTFDMDCKVCHSHQTAGRGGDVPPERCYSCHNEPGRLARSDDSEFLHTVHVTEHNVFCMYCHLELEHGALPDFQAAETGCEGCHETGHSPQRSLYAGIGGRGVEAMPAPMFLAGIGCEGCHLRLEGQTAEASPATEVSCMSCHGPRYRPVYGRWKRLVAERTGGLRRQLRSTSARLGGEPPQQLVDARYNLDLVARGKGIHNVHYALALLARSQEWLNEARQESGLQPLSPPWPEVPYEAPCLNCHLGIESHGGRPFGRPFEHRTHVSEQAIQCETCHRPHQEKPEGESFRFGPEGCAGCHHSQPAADCRSCHQGVMERSVESFRGVFLHALHVDMVGDCVDCHQRAAEQNMAADREVCSMCH